MVAQFLEQEVVPALSGPAQHHARVAASLVSIVERELEMVGRLAESECSSLASMLGTRGDAGLSVLRADAARALRAGMADADDVAADVWSVLMAGVRGDLKIVKPGHDAWEGE